VTVSNKIVIRLLTYVNKVIVKDPTTP